MFRKLILSYVIFSNEFTLKLLKSSFFNKKNLENLNTRISAVVLNSTSSKFVGFLLQARLASRQGQLIGHLRAGEFVSDLPVNWAAQGVKVHQCAPVFNDSLTHVDTVEKSELQVGWRTLQIVGPVQFV